MSAIFFSALGVRSPDRYPAATHITLHPRLGFRRMDFSSPLFLFLFLPAVLAGYWCLGVSVRNLYLLGASLFLYMWVEGRFVLVLLLSLAVNYLFTMLIDRCQRAGPRRFLLVVTVAANLALLGAFKYLIFLVENLNRLLLGVGLAPVGLTPMHLPTGLSFFTFQAMAYAIDIYRQQYAPQRNVIKFSLFFALFPKISAGPIIRYPEVEAALARPEVSLEVCASGAKRFILGMGKKLIIADTLAETSRQIFSIPAGDLTASLAWLAIVCYMLQLYFDFSGYTDMAIGLGRLLGFSMGENFNYPYLARSVTEFWRRWHISLSSWFKDYVFLPLSFALMTPSVRQRIMAGRYKTNYRSLLSVVIVFTLCGAWHGASWNFIVWGLLHGLVLALENWKLSKVLQKAWPPLAHAYLLLFLLLSWVIFRASTLSEAVGYIMTMAGLGSGTGSVYHPSLFINLELLVVLPIAVLGSLPLAGWWRAWQVRLGQLPAATGSLTCGGLAEALEAGFVVVVFILSLLAVAGSTYKPFIYYQF